MAQAQRKRLNGATYSKRERDLFAMLSLRSRVSTLDLIAKYYGDQPQPIYARSTIVDAMRRLAKKMDRSQEQLRVASSERSGPRPIEFWLEQR